MEFLISSLKKNRFSKIDPFVIGLLSKDTWLCGGSMRTLIDKKDTLCDYDLFFGSDKAKEETEKKVIASGATEVFRCPKGELITFLSGDMKIQLITKKTYKSLIDCVNSFDITACCSGIDDKTLYITGRFIDDVKHKRIDFNAVEYPLATFKRMIKYAKKGYHTTEDGLLNLFSMVNMVEFDETKMALYVD